MRIGSGLWEAAVGKENLTQVLIDMQMLFEKSRKGIDGDLYAHNTLAHSVNRGLIGEAREALEVLKKPDSVNEYFDIEELTEEQLTEFISEIIDVYIFLHSIFGKLGMSAEDVMDASISKLARNFQKYQRSFLEGRTVNDGMMWSRMMWRQE